MEPEIKEMKNGLKLLTFPKPKIELTDGQRAEADKFVAQSLVREVLENDGPEMERVLVLYRTKDGTLRWVGNMPDNASIAWFMEEIKFAMLEQEVLCEEDEPDPRNPA